MTYDEFWYGDPKQTKYYLKAYELKCKREDTDLWKQGVYEYVALCKVAPILHAFAKSGTKPEPFPEKSIFIRENKDEEKKKVNMQEVENERMKAQVFFNNWFRSTKKHFSEKWEE